MISPLHESQCGKHGNFENESEHSASRAGKKDRAGHQYGAEGDQGSLPASQQMAHTHDQGKRY